MQRNKLAIRRCRLTATKMASITAEEVKESLSIFDIEAKEDALEKMLEIAGLFDFDADSIVNEWLAYQSTHGCSLNVENLDKLLLEKTVARNKGRNNQTPSATRKRNAYCAENIEEFEKSLNDEADDSLLSAYGTPGRARNKEIRMSNTTPRSSIKAHSSVYPSSTPMTAFSPSTLSPSTPSQKYGNRNNRGDVVASYGPNNDALSVYRGHGRPITIVTNRRNAMTKAVKYMFQKLVDLSDVMDYAIEASAEAVRCQREDEINAFTSCCLSSQEPVFITGRICCDQGGGVGRLNSQSVLLQGCKAISGGKSVQVDLSHMDEYSLFPGQIVVMQGTNPTGKKFIPTKIYTPRPSLTQSKDRVPMATEPLSVLIAAGPFTTSDCLSYEPLNDLIEVAKTTKPDVTLIVGPIVDNKHEDVKPEKMKVTYEDFLQDRLNYIMEALKGCTQVVFVPCLREAGCHPVYPQPPYAAAIRAKDVHFVTDPSVLEIEGVTVAVTSNDILFHLGAEEISKVKGSSDRLGRLAGHVLQQKSFYPLYPSSENVNVDWIAAEQFGAITDRPDILILPSDLKCFVKQIEGCVCINPGRLAKGLTGGTYAQVLVEPSASGVDDATAGISVQVLKI